MSTAKCVSYLESPTLLHKMENPKSATRQPKATIPVKGERRGLTAVASGTRSTSQEAAKSATKPQTDKHAGKLGKTSSVPINPMVHLPLVHKFARRFQWACTSGILSYDDLIQAGMLGVIHAIKKFKPSLGYKFSTYAAPWIKHYIGRTISNDSNCVRVPIHKQRVASKNGDVKLAGMLSLDTPVVDEFCELLTHKDMLQSNTPSQDECVNTKERFALLPQMISFELSSEHAHIITRLHIDCVGVVVLARELGLSRDTIRLHEIEAMQILKACASRWV